MIQRLRVRVFGNKASKLDVLHAASHDMSSDDEFIVLEAAAQKASALEFNGFAVVLCFFVVHVRIPHRIVFVADFDDVRVDVKRKRVFDIIDFDIVRTVFVNDVAVASAKLISW